MESQNSKRSATTQAPVLSSHLFRYFWLASLLAYPFVTFAHQGSTSYLTLSVEEHRIRGRWEIPVADLYAALQLDRDRDHKVRLNELQTRSVEIKDYALRHLKLSTDGTAHPILITNTALTLETFVDGASTSLDFVVTNLARPKILEVEYRFMFDRKPLDRGFLQIDCRGGTQTAVFTADRPIQRFSLERRSGGREFLSFARHGAWHIWIGFDHILFLMRPARACNQRHLFRHVPIRLSKGCIVHRVHGSIQLPVNVLISDIKERIWVSS